MSNFSYQVDDDKNKKITFIYNGESLGFKLRIKRSFTVLKAVAKKYPHFLDIHELDNILSDPNRAHSDLRNEDGFANFLIENRGANRNMMLKLNVPSLFAVFSSSKNKDAHLEIYSIDKREGLLKEEQEKVWALGNGCCNITGLKLYKMKQIKSQNLFLKRLLKAEFDHRRPLTKNGSNDISNFQLLSETTNKEKNKICQSCTIAKCEECALAYPEKFHIILGNNQDIKEISKHSYNV